MPMSPCPATIRPLVSFFPLTLIPSHAHVGVRPLVLKITEGYRAS
jgi:hypothetical protein